MNIIADMFRGFPMMAHTGTNTSNQGSAAAASPQPGISPPLNPLVYKKINFEKMD